VGYLVKIAEQEAIFPVLKVDEFVPCSLEMATS